MEIVRKDDAQMAAFIAEKMAIPRQAVTLDKGSALIVDDAGRRWRLPLGNEAFDAPTGNGELRICREVATERDLFNCYGTFYELPAENADGFAKIRPIASHNLRINDYASYRGLLVLTGVSLDTKPDGHIFVSKDKKAAVWAGAIDDLWKLGKPVGHGGPWANEEVKADVPSDPYLTGFYDKRTLTLQHNSDKTVTFTVEADPTGYGNWMAYIRIEVAPGEKKRFEFPRSFSARWLRFLANTDTRATAWLDYE